MAELAVGDFVVLVKDCDGFLSTEGAGSDGEGFTICEGFADL
jgi:hypothetical protein